MNSLPSGSFDVTVIGAGPAGLNAALHLLSGTQKPRVLIVDKSIPWEKPIACAEAVGRLGFHEALDVNPAWLRFEIGKARFHAPCRESISYTDRNKGYIINRARMQHDLFERACRLGAEAALNTRVVAVRHQSPSRRSITFEGGRAIDSTIVIDASGPLSSIGKGEKIPHKALDLEPSYFAVVAGIDYPNDTVHIRVGQTIAPGGYAWVFPRDGETYNVGVVVGKHQAPGTNIRALLQNFITNNYPKARILHTFAGPIPCYVKRQPQAIPGLFKAGDAASTINPISRAGIVESLLSGGLAGDYALSMLGATTEKQARGLCKEYEHAWFEKRGKRHGKLAKVKSALIGIPDGDYDAAIKTLSTIPADDLKMSTIFKVSLSRSPRLVWAMRHLI